MNCKICLNRVSTLIYLFFFVNKFNVVNSEFSLTYNSINVLNYTCLPTWILIGDQCYYPIFEAADWNSALRICNSIGGSIANPPQYSVNVLLFNQIEQQFRSSIGFNDSTVWLGWQTKENATKLWSPTKEITAYTPNWNHQEPKTVDIIGCISVSESNQTIGWNAESCEEIKPFVCQIRSCPNGYTRCQDNTMCILSTKWCDDQHDCDDGSDELACDQKNGCGGTIYGTDGVITSPNFPKSYSNDMNCNWIINGPYHSRIRVELEFCYLEDPYDLLEFYHGSSVIESNLIKSLTGYPPVPFTVELSRSNTMLIHFFTDYLGTEDGFKLKWTAVGGCGGRLQATNSKSLLISANHPNPYPQNEECFWVISGESGAVISIEFENFDLENNVASLSIHNGETSNEPQIATLTGNVLPVPITSTGNKIFIHFKNTGRNEMRSKGFKLSFKIGCDVILKADYGRISSPGFAWFEDYPKNLDCTWTIISSKPQTLHFVPSFETEEDYDIVKVYNGTIDTNSFSEFSGKIAPASMRFPTGEFVVRFLTNNARAHKGWAADFSKDCSLTINQSNHNQQEVPFQQLIQVSCNEGYTSNEASSKLICMSNGNWNRPLPSCNPVNCSMPPAINGGQVVRLEGTFFQNSATYQCYEGFNLINIATVTCGSNGEWSTPPICQRISCPIPEILPNGFIINTSDCSNDCYYQDVVVYQCDPGFSTSDSPTIHCTQFGNWSGPVPTCKLRFCARPEISNGNIIGNGPFEYNSSAEFTCNEGYIPRHHIGFCSVGGIWLNLPNCEDFDECSDQETNECTFTCVNTEGSYKCICGDGYQPAPGSDKECIDINECLIDNGECGAICINTVGSYHCACPEGYDLFTEDGLHGNYLKPGETGSNPNDDLRFNKTCVLITCPRPPEVENSVLTSSIHFDDRYVFTDVIVYSCILGFYMNGSKEITCMADGTWSASDTKCEPYRCNAPPEIANGAYEISDPNYSVDSYVVYHCNDGFRLEGLNKRYCRETPLPQYRYRQSSLHWSDDEPVCKRISCQPPLVLQNGYQYGLDIKYQAEIQYICQKGYTLHGISSRNCMANGMWSGTHPVCSVGLCSPPSTLQHGEISGNRFTLGSSISFSCVRPGYVLEGNNELTCSLPNLESFQQNTFNGDIVTLECYSCNDASSSLECQLSGTLVQCSDNEVCNVKWRKDGDRLIFNKGCQVKSTCEEESLFNPDNCLIESENCSLCCSELYCNIAPVDESFKPIWNGSTPLCNDVAPPVFINCPSDIYVLFGANGIQLPVYFNYLAIDNSGLKPIYWTIPEDLSSPYVFTRETNVSVYAKDQAGNTAVCTFSVQFNDTIPPRIDCYREIVIVEVNTTEPMHPAIFPELVITDNVAVTQVIYEPPNGSMIPLNKILLVNVTALDAAGNIAKCSFNYELQPNVCVMWTLHAPDNVILSCSDPVGTSSGSAFSCQARCKNSSLEFVEPPLQQYICKQGSGWDSTYIPDCQFQIIPAVVISADFSFAVDRNLSDCLFIYHQAIANMENKFATQCQNWPQVAVTIDAVDLVQNSPTLISGKLHLLITPESNALINTLLITACERNLIKYLNEVKIELKSPARIAECVVNSTVVVELPPVVDRDCPPGHVTSPRKTCLPCSTGTFYNASKCHGCLAGTYQDELAQTECKNCPENSGTLSDRNKDNSACVDFCSPGEYSLTGLVPCIKCPVGQYTPSSGSKLCDRCPPGTSTTAIGSPSQESCRSPCSPGTYSPDGFKPCSLCPNHFFQEVEGSSYCQECPPDKVTLEEGSSNFSNCIRVDQCEQHKCENGATCLDKHRYYKCECVPGFEGTFCEINIDECEHAPCFNGATCIDGINMFTCTCETGFIGDLCENVTNECEPEPCENGATCVDKHLDFDCICLPGFEDKTCSLNIDECLSNPCENGGNCTDLINGYECDCSNTGFEGVTCQFNIDDCLPQPCNNRTTYNCTDGIKSFTCFCNPGFTGDLCEIDIDECSSNPCQHDSICIDLENAYHCDCKPGYEGVNCEIDINECESSPCQNNATCVDRINKYECNCVLGYEGVNCEIDIDDCALEPCYYGGTCVDHVANYSCICAPGFEGRNCSDFTDECEPEPCQNGATCEDLHLNYFCHCVPGYIGRECEVDIDECLSSPCVHGNCSDLINSYNCSCFPGWTGINCEIDIDECESSPCLNGGNCSDLVNGFLCRCSAGFAGDTCEIDIDDCLSNPCQFGNCTDLVNDYLCTCNPGYTGKECHIDIDECASSPCLNNGTCNDLINGYWCDCLIEYNGTHCELQIDDCLLNNTCENGATCVDGWRDISCVCTPEFYGPQCKRRKSDVFDLLFHGESGSISDPPPVSANQTKELSLCFWVRYGGQDSKGTYLTLLDVSDSGSKNVILEFEEEQLLLHSGNNPDAIPIKTNNGSWEQLCFLWNFDTGNWKLFRHGFAANTGANFRTGGRIDNLQVILGQRQTPGPQKQFFGELSRVNVWKRLLSTDDISILSYNCTAWNEYGDLRLWVEFAEHIKNDVDIVKPGLCAHSNCSIGWEGTTCNIINDKVPPTVAFCPSDMKFFNQSRLIQGTWEEPRFEDNVAVVKVESNYRSGGWFNWGEYLVTYAAYDLAENIAICSFTITFTPFNCTLPEAPVNGIRACDTHFYGLFCTIKCIDKDFFDFLDLPPPFYSCSKEGVWDNKNPIAPFVFPKCAPIYPPIPGIEGSFLYDLECTEQKKQQVLNDFKNVIIEMNNKIQICGVAVCDFSKAVVSCGTIDINAKRTRREANGNKIIIDFFMPVNITDASDIIEVSVKNGTFDKAANVEKGTFLLQDAYACKPGSVLKDKKCVQCPRGSYYDSWIEKCIECPIGQYQELEGQEMCNVCPQKKTTERTGAFRINHCYKSCYPGEYFNIVTDTCEKCKKGTYQKFEGKLHQISCLPCFRGVTTENEGTTSETECSVYCQLGEELNGDEYCEPCPIGSYKDSLNQMQCQKCPLNFVTSKPGRISQSDCNIDIRCVDYCKNEGICRIEQSKPVCACLYHYRGTKCEKYVISSNLWYIIGITAGCVVLLFILGVSIYCCFQRSKTKEMYTSYPRRASEIPIYQENIQMSMKAQYVQNSIKENEAFSSYS